MDGGEAGGGDAVMADAPPVSDGKMPDAADSDSHSSNHETAAAAAAAVGGPLPIEASSGSPALATTSRLPSLTGRYLAQSARLDALAHLVDATLVHKRRRLLGQLWAAAGSASGGGGGGGGGTAHQYDAGGRTGGPTEIRRSHLRLFLTHRVQTVEEVVAIGAPPPPPPAPAPASAPPHPAGGAAAALAAVGVGVGSAAPAAAAANAASASAHGAATTQSVATAAPRGKTLTKKRRKWTLVVEGLPLVGQLDHESALAFDERLAEERRAREEGGKKWDSNNNISHKEEKSGLAKERVATYADPEAVPEVTSSSSASGAGSGSGGAGGGGGRQPLVFTHYFDKVECTFRTIRKKAAVLANASHQAPGAGSGIDGTGGGGTPNPTGTTDPDAAAAAAAAAAIRANKSRRQVQMEERAAREAASAAAKKRAAELAAKRKAEAATGTPETADDLVLGDVTTLTWSRTTDGKGSSSSGNTNGNTNGDSNGSQDNKAFHFAYTDTPTAPYTDANTLPDLTDGDRVVCTVTLQRRSGEEHRYVPSKKLCRELFPPLLKDLDKCAWLLDEPWEHTDAAKDERLAKARAEAEARAVAEAEQKRLEEERRVAEEKRRAIEAERRRIVEEKARVKAEKAAARAAKKAADAMKTPAKKRKKAEPGTRKVRCGECLACTRDDCGQCKYCLDKPKFGGSHRMKKPCELRQCTNPKVISVGGGGGSGVTSPGLSPSPAVNPAIPGHPLPPSDAASVATTATASSGMMPGVPTAVSLGSTGMPGFPSGFPYGAPQPAFPPPQPAQPSAQHLPQVQPQPQSQVQPQPSIQQPQPQVPPAVPPSTTAVPPAGMPMVLPSVPPPGATVAVTAPGLMSALQKSEDKIPKKKKTKAKIKISAQQVKAAASRGSSPTLDDTSPAAIAAAKELAAAQEAARKEEERRRKEEEEARKRDAIIKKLDPYHPPLENDIIMPPTLTRSEALRAIFLYIKDNRLQDVSDLSTINNDAKLEELFGCKQMQFSQVNSLLLSRKLLLPANPADTTDKKADAPIKFVYVMSADGADVSTMVDLEEDPMLLLGEDYAPTMMSCDVDVNLPGMFQERTRELMRRIKAREYEYNSARNRAHKALLPSGSNKVDEDIVKEAMEDTVNGRGLSASTNLPVLLALAREAPEGSEVGLQSAADARIADILERLEQKVQAAQACRDIVEACKSGSL